MTGFSFSRIALRFHDRYGTLVESDEDQDTGKPTKLVEDDSSGGGTNVGGIGFLGGLCLLLNNMTGPGIPLLVVVTAASGSIVSVLLLLATAAVAGMSGAFLLEAMSANRCADGAKVGFVKLAKMKLSRGAYRAVLIAFFFNLPVMILHSTFPDLHCRPWA